MFVKIPKFIQFFYPSITWRKKTHNKEIWLTFDDGPDPKTTPLILNILKEKNITATFFLIGEKMEKFPALVKDIYNNGHTVGNHTYTHLNGWKCGTIKYLKDVKKCQKLIPKNKIFRPPYGKIKRSQLLNLRKGYEVVLWDVMAYDFLKKISPFKVKENIINNVRSGSIIVLHNNKKSYTKIEPILLESIEILEKKGYKFSSTW